MSAPPSRAHQRQRVRRSISFSQEQDLVTYGSGSPQTSGRAPRPRMRRSLTVGGQRAEKKETRTFRLATFKPFKADSRSYNVATSEELRESIAALDEFHHRWEFLKRTRRANDKGQYTGMKEDKQKIAVFTLLLHGEDQAPEISGTMVGPLSECGTKALAPFVRPANVFAYCTSRCTVRKDGVRKTRGIEMSFMSPLGNDDAKALLSFARSVSRVPPKVLKSFVSRYRKMFKVSEVMKEAMLTTCEIASPGIILRNLSQADYREIQGIYNPKQTSWWMPAACACARPGDNKWQKAMKGFTELVSDDEDDAVEGEDGKANDEKSGMKMGRKTITQIGRDMNSWVQDEREYGEIVRERRSGGHWKAATATLAAGSWLKKGAAPAGSPQKAAPSLSAVGRNMNAFVKMTVDDGGKKVAGN